MRNCNGSSLWFLYEFIDNLPGAHILFARNIGDDRCNHRQSLFSQEGSKLGFKSFRRIGANIKTLRSEANSTCIKICCLKNDRLCFGRHLGLCSTLDSRNPKNGIFVCDNKNALTQSDILSIKRGKGLALPCATDNDLAARDLVEVKCMEWLPHHEHHIIRRIN